MQENYEGRIGSITAGVSDHCKPQYRRDFRYHPCGGNARVKCVTKKMASAILKELRILIKRLLFLSLVTLTALIGSLLASIAVHHLSAIRPYKLDLFIYQIEAALFGFQPSFAMGRFLHHFPMLRTAALFAYDGMPLAIVAILWLYVQRRWETFRLLCVLMVNLCAAIPIYLLVPVAGPRYAFTSFPNAAPPFIPHWMFINAPPNGIPSVHFSTALLIYLFARRAPTGRILAWVYLLLTFAATLGFGEHYLLDLLLAIPYTYCIWWASTRGHLPSTPATPPF